MFQVFVFCTAAVLLGLIVKQIPFSNVPNAFSEQRTKFLLDKNVMAEFPITRDEKIRLLSNQS